MAGDEAGPPGADDPAKKDDDEVVPPSPKKKRGFVSRVWEGIFGRSEDYEKRLQYLSKEEASVSARMKRRAVTSRSMLRNLIASSVVIEVLAVVYAIMTARSVDLNWQMRALRFLPMFLLPGLSSVIYTSLVSFTRMLDRKDQKTLERLRAERKTKIDELKERTNYYTTQQLIQKYDLDPAAKAAAATVLASKLGSDSGLKVYVGDESKTIAQLAQSSDTAESVQPDGLRNRKKSHSTSNSAGTAITSQGVSESSVEFANEGQEVVAQSQKVVEHYQGSGSSDGGWIARIAALLVGEDPSQSYALICGNCHRHNGLSRKEDFPHITYYCPHCHALNTSQLSGRHISGASSDAVTPLAPAEEKEHKENYAQIAATESEITSKTATVPELPSAPNDAKLNI